MPGRSRRTRWFVVAFLLGLAAVPAREVQGAGEFVPLGEPARLLDTRPGHTTIDGEFAAIGVRAAGSTFELEVAGRGGLPDDPASVVLNVTVVNAQGWGFVTVHPSGTSRPTASGLNYDTGDTIANTVVTPVGDDGHVLLYTFAATHLLVDATGHFPADAFDALPAAARLLDTRAGHATVDGEFAAVGRRSAGSTLELDVAGRAGIPADATAVVLNVTAVRPDGWGFLTVHPSGTGLPNASNLNYVGGRTIANTVVTALGEGGRISIHTYAATDLVVDVAGSLPADVFTPLPSPARLVDTRLGAATVDGRQAGIGLRGASSSLRVEVAGRAGIPADASSVVLNVTAVRALGWGFVTAFATGVAEPDTSNLNYESGTTIANTVVARLGAGGDVCVSTHWATHLLVDVIGHLEGPAPPPAGPVCPLMAYGLPQSLAGGATVADVNNAGIAVGTDWDVSDGSSTAVWWPTLGSAHQLVPGLPADVRSSHALSVNERGRALVGTDSVTSGYDLLVIDLPSGHIAARLPDLEGIPALAGVDVSRATGHPLNDRGEVVLNLVQGDHDPDGAIAVWDSVTGAIVTHPDLLDVAWAYDLNDVGLVVGSVLGDDDLFDAFVWDLDADVLRLLDPGTFEATWARGVNDRGQVVGAASDGHGGAPAVFWSHLDAEPTTIPGASVWVWRINEAGLVWGSRSPAGSTWNPPGVWDSVSGEWLEFPVEFGDSIHAINDVGQVVGSTGEDQPALWNPS